MAEQPPSPAVFGFDAYAPAQIAERIENVGVTKAALPLRAKLVLGVLAGGFIGLGALFFTIVVADTSLPFAVTRTLGGLVFSLGLLLVVVAGAELFTGNNLLVMAWAARRLSTRAFVADLLIIYVANLVGAAGLALLVALAHHDELGGGAVGRAAVRLAAQKAALPLDVAFFRAILCNMLVCLAVWLTFAGRTVIDKAVAIVFPISAFVAAGFEHSVANMYLLPLGLLLRHRVATDGIADLDALTVGGLLHNLIPVTAGNLIGGVVLVGLVYTLVYGSQPKAE